ncbi:MAG: nucleotidyl transferase AbiEii/AbiGii toxin family protein [Candidatus Aenigmarchaeota archaeon]|nr:nucleotidyl transferase AbiEii/AbiGii toxin family protein [Candidatus Aenigmarchaeota archaeon]
MISREDLRDYARIKGLNLGQAEKDYFQNIILFILFQEYGKTLVFKGGTALSKCYGSSRFSEDLDFTCGEDFRQDILERGLRRFGLEYSVKLRAYAVGKKLTLRIKGPLYIGTLPSQCTLILDISFRENIVLTPEIIPLGSLLKEIPGFSVYVMDENEIFAEKVRVIMTRDKARDVYDLWFLLGKGIKFDFGLIEKKLEYYKDSWSKGKFIKAVQDKEKIWKTEMKPLIENVPEFKEVKSLIAKSLENGPAG